MSNYKVYKNFYLENMHSVVKQIMNSLTDLTVIM